MAGQLSRLESLPIELLYEIHLHAVSPHLSMSSRWLHNVFCSAPPTLTAEYLGRKIFNNHKPMNRITFQTLLTRALRYPVCDHAVFRQLVLQFPPAHSTDGEAVQELSVTLEAPRRLFRFLSSSEAVAPQNISHDPLPFLTQLPHLHETLPPSFTNAFSLVIDLDVNSNEGYALVRSVHAEAYPLIQFLLGHGARPGLKRGLAVIIAVRKKNLDLVKMLIEKDFVPPQLQPKRRSGKKRRKLDDRCEVTQEMLKIAVKSKAKDIVTYFTQVKGCIPDMETLQIMF